MLAYKTHHGGLMGVQIVQPHRVPWQQVVPIALKQPTSTN